jgi:hypothetical protein
MSHKAAEANERFLKDVQEWRDTCDAISALNYVLAHKSETGVRWEQTWDTDVYMMATLLSEAWRKPQYELTKLLMLPALGDPDRLRMPLRTVCLLSRPTDSLVDVSHLFWILNELDRRGISVAGVIIVNSPSDKLPRLESVLKERRVRYRIWT